MAKADGQMEACPFPPQSDSLVVDRPNFSKGPPNASRRFSSDQHPLDVHRRCQPRGQRNGDRASFGFLSVVGHRPVARIVHQRIHLR